MLNSKFIFTFARQNEVKQKHLTIGNKVNYEEMLAARNEGKKKPTRQPIGDYYRHQVDGKWHGLVDINPVLNGNIVFNKALEAECEKNTTLANNHLIHFTPRKAADGDIEQLELELGNFQPFQQLLLDNPAVVAGKDFINNTLRALVDVTEYLHSQGIFHICYSPRTVFARKGDNSVLLLSHGSFYMNISDLQQFYGEDAQYVAPEVLNHGTVDERCDVYGIGMFMLNLLEQSDLPLEYRKALKKAVSETPEDRYQTPRDILRAVETRRSTIRTVVSLAVAAGVALVCLGLYFDMFPESSPVEFVKPAPRQATDDLIDDGFDPSELGVASDGDSLVYDGSLDSAAYAASERDYQAKAEEIFRKNYEKEADRILSKIYNKEYMSNAEKKFTAESSSTIEELMQKQAELGEAAGLTPERAQLIASEIIDHVTDQKKKEMGGTNSRAIQK